MGVRASHSEAEPDGKGAAISSEEGGGEGKGKKKPIGSPVMATGLSDNLKHPTMVWEIKTNQMPTAVQKVLLVMDKRTSGMNEALDLLKYDLPELQAVHSDSTPPALFQLSAHVSHQEYARPSWNPHTSGSSPESTYPQTVNQSLAFSVCHHCQTMMIWDGATLGLQLFGTVSLKGNDGIREATAADGLKLISTKRAFLWLVSTEIDFDPHSSQGLTHCRMQTGPPFYVKNKGWSSFYPSLTVVQHGIPCCEMHLVISSTSDTLRPSTLTILCF
ncbi:hypothetical protein E2320_005859 [Naja naja]|nr:hypothetical protein E2320_005859 [Naja naja]